MRRRVLATLALALLLPAGAALAQSSVGGGGGNGGGGSGAVTITGQLPAFASTPTFNVGTIAGIATDTSVQQVRTALGSPFQAGGSIANTAFGISGTLPNFATPPTVNLGTVPRTEFVTEANGSAAGANAVVSGAARDAGTSPSRFTRCSAVVSSTQAGTLQLWMNPDGSVWKMIGSVAVVANVPQTLTLPIFGRYCQLRYANGGTAATFDAFTSLSAN